MNLATIVLTSLKSAAVAYQFDVARIAMVRTAATGLKKDGTVVEYQRQHGEEPSEFHVRETVTEITRAMQTAQERYLSLRR